MCRLNRNKASSLRIQWICYDSASSLIRFYGNRFSSSNMVSSFCLLCRFSGSGCHHVMLSGSHVMPIDFWLQSMAVACTFFRPLSLLRSIFQSLFLSSPILRRFFSSRTRKRENLKTTFRNYLPSLFAEQHENYRTTHTHDTLLENDFIRFPYEYWESCSAEITIIGTQW